MPVAPRVTPSLVYDVPLFTTFLLATGHTAAGHARFDHDDSDDLAVAFAEYHLTGSRRKTLALLPRNAQEAYLRECATNAVLDFSRAKRRRERREQPQCVWQTRAGDGDCPPESTDDHAPDPEATLIFHELRQRLLHALEHLGPGQRDLILRHDFHGELVVAIAASLGETPNATAQRLHRARRHLRRVLKEQDMDEGEACGYLQILCRSPH